MSARPRAALAAVLGVITVTFLVYLRTLHPGLPGGDSGELIAAAHTRGIAHPPGYPLLLILGHLFSFLPWGSIGWRVNLLSAICDALAAGLLAGIIIRWSGRLLPGIAAALVFAFSPCVWTYATAAEVFPLNNLLLAALLATSLEFALTNRYRWAVLAALVTGLGMSNQHAFALTAIPLILWALLVPGPGLVRPRRLAVLAAVALAGLLPYAYLVVAGSQMTSVTWGETATPSGFLDHLLRRHVGTFTLATPREGSDVGLAHELGLYGLDLTRELLGIGLLVALLGARASLRQARTLARLPQALLLAYAFYILFFHALANLPVQHPLFLGIQKRFWQQPLLLVTIWLGLGLAFLQDRFPRAVRAGTVLAVLLQVALGWSACDQRDNRHLETYARTLLEKLPRDSVLLAEGDLAIFSTYYVQTCEGVRRDVLVLDLATLSYGWRKRWVHWRRPSLVLPGDYYCPFPRPGGFGLQAFLEANLDRFPVFSYAAIYAHEPELEKRYTGGHPGVLEPVRRRGPVAFDAWRREIESYLLEFPLPSVVKYGPETWEYLLFEQYFHPRRFLAIRLLEQARNEGNVSLLREGTARLEEIVARHPDLPSGYRKELALATASLAEHEPGLRDRVTERWRQYLESGPERDADLPRIRLQVPRLAGQE